MMLTVSSGMPTNSGASNSPASKEEKKLQEEELLYNPLLSQQQELLQLHQEQRRQLLVQQQEQRLAMFEEQRKREVAAATGQQQQHTAASREPPPSYNTDGGLRAMLSQSATQGSSRQPGDQDTGASFSGWSETNYPLGEAEEQVLNLLLAESTSFDPLLDNIEWGDDAYSSEVNLNPD